MHKAIRDFAVHDFEVHDFYDELAEEYHLLFENWDESIVRQAAVLGPILERRCGPARGATILDCACGIGTQALGLAGLGFRIVGCDLSVKATERARTEAFARRVDATFHPVDMRQLHRIPETGFDAVICMDNALPHLSTRDDLTEAVAEVHAKLQNGGVFVASIRDYDRLVLERPNSQPPAFFWDGEQRRIVFQLWDWHAERVEHDELSYTFHLYITRQTAAGWVTHHYTSNYRALLREELTEILRDIGFVDIEWMSPDESGFYQPIVIATKKHSRN